MSKPEPRLCMIIKKPISEKNEWALIIISSYIVIYQMILQKKTCLQNKRKTMRGEAFRGLKTQELPGALPPGPPPGRCPWTPPGVLERAPGPHAVKTLRSLCSLRSTWTQTIFLQHPAVTNPAHAHAHSVFANFVHNNHTITLILDTLQTIVLNNEVTYRGLTRGVLGL